MTKETKEANAKSVKKSDKPIILVRIRSLLEDVIFIVPKTPLTLVKAESTIDEVTPIVPETIL